MKHRFIIIMFLCFCCIAVHAQKQTGFVRTAGTSKSKGIGIDSVQIRAEGSNPTFSGKDGKFSVMLSDKQQGDSFVFTKIYLNGYELLEKDGLRKKYVHSQEVPVEIVMISSNELLRIQNEIKETARKNAEKKYKKQKKQLDALLRKQKLSIENYRAKIDSLEKQMEMFEHLLPGMAEHYARTDYDKLDSLNREINKCIVNGELEKADSLINTKGNVIERAHDNIKEGGDITKAESELQAAKAKVNANKEALEEEKRRIDVTTHQQEEIDKQREKKEVQ